MVQRSDVSLSFTVLNVLIENIFFFFYTLAAQNYWLHYVLHLECCIIINLAKWNYELVLIWTCLMNRTQENAKRASL